MSTSRTTTTTTTQPTASTSSHPTDPPSPGVPADEDEDSIMRDTLARVERMKVRKAEEETAARSAEEERKKKEAAARASAARRKAVQEARDRATRAQQQNVEVVERRRLLVEAATARSQWGTLPSEMSVSPWRPVVEIRREKGKGREKVPVQPVGGDLDNGDDDNDEEREPCERCKAKKIPCLQQAGKRSSVICKPCHDSKVHCSFSGRPLTSKREGGSGGQLQVPPIPPPAVKETGRQPCLTYSYGDKDGHDGHGIMEESEEEEEEKEVEEDKEVEKDGEGEEEEMVLTEAQLEKERAE
ncbi:hypothetical protein F5877DRAFT_84829 [Lentinula edodes]|nr:hypothetical protein F5877DRAFT_84829 [Lentinula edodes]